MSSTKIEKAKWAAPKLSRLAASLAETGSGTGEGGSGNGPNAS